MAGRSRARYDRDHRGNGQAVYASASRSSRASAAGRVETAQATQDTRGRVAAAPLHTETRADRGHDQRVFYLPMKRAALAKNHLVVP
jgi:hypothetical protein